MNSIARSIFRSIVYIVFCVGVAPGPLAEFGCAGAGRLFGDEPARAFLDGLRARDLNDVAIEYLDAMATSPLVPAEFKETILIEKAATLAAEARNQRDIEAASALLDQSQALLQQFIAQKASHPKANSARSQLGSLIFERARTKMAQAETGQRDARIRDARQLYEQSFTVFEELHLAISGQLDEIPKVLDTRDRKQSALAQKRTQLRADNLQTELLAAAAREEIAQTFPEGSNEYRTSLTNAAELYDGIYKNYRGRLAGYYARMYQGRCNQRLGKLRDALGYYGELLDQPNVTQGMFELKTKTLRLAMECWLSPSQRKYRETIKQGTKWLELLPPNQDRQSDWLAIRLHLARALKMQAEAAQALDPPESRIAQESIDSAMIHARFVASEQGDFQDEASQLVIDLGGVIDSSEPSEPETFTEAQKKAKESLDAIEPARRKVLTAQNAYAVAKGAQRNELANQVQQTQQEFLTAQSEAIRYYRLALRLAGRETPQADVNLVRYFLCYLYYLKKDYYESALLGEFVSTRYPDSAGARECAKISLACYLMIFVENAGQDRAFEVGRLFRVSSQIAKRWPGNASNDSIVMVIPHLVNAGELDRALQLTRLLPESSPRRFEAELVTGQAFWNAAITSMQDLQAEQKVDPDLPNVEGREKQIAADRSQSVELLAAAYSRYPSNWRPTTQSAIAMLSLARGYVIADRFDDAIDVLTHPHAGPLTLVESPGDAEQPSEFVAEPAFIEETYRTALQAYVASLGIHADEHLPEALRLMSALQGSVANSPMGQQRMMGVYTNLAMSIESQMELATPDSKKALSEVFEKFLDQLAANASDPGVLNWVAETLTRIGSGLQGENATLQEDARKYFEKSAVAFENLLQDPTVPAAIATQVRVRLAIVKGRLRQFSESLAILETVLAANPSAVNVQVEAARLLQGWGREDPSKYTQAITGIDTASSNVWGWGKIASTTLSHKEFRDLFYEARYEIARCQLDRALLAGGDAGKKLLADAEKTLSLTRTLYPTLGGPTWTVRYHDLLNEVLKASGKPVLPPLKIAQPAVEIAQPEDEIQPAFEQPASQETTDVTIPE